MTKIKLQLSVNGRTVKRSIPPTLHLLDLLRDDLGLTGAKEVCTEGECGACTVLLDGRPVNSCLILAVECAGAKVVTVEGIDHPIQEAMEKTHAVQCGYCFPGMVLTAADLIERGRAGNRREIRDGLAGNVCRCTGYSKIIDAVEETARKGVKWTRQK